jgi:hypothetical protein
MNDQRANQPAAQNLAARRSCGKPFGGGLGTEGRLPVAGSHLVFRDVAGFIIRAGQRPDPAAQSAPLAARSAHRSVNRA